MGVILQFTKSIFSVPTIFINASLTTTSHWTHESDERCMRIMHHSRPWLLQGPFPPAMLVHLAMSIINADIFYSKCAQLVWDATGHDSTLIFCCARKSLTTRAPCGQAFVVRLKCDGVSPSSNDWNNMFLLISSRCCMPFTSIIFKDVRPLAVCKIWIHQRGNHKSYIKEGQTTQWPKEKEQKAKQRSTKHYT